MSQSGQKEEIKWCHSERCEGRQGYIFSLAVPMLDPLPAKGITLQLYPWQGVPGGRELPSPSLHHLHSIGNTEKDVSG